MVVFYHDRSGRRPVTEFLDSLPPEDRAAVLHDLALLEEFGLDVGWPHVRAVTGRRKLWELRVKSTSGAIRLFYFAYHGLVKKTRKVPRRELDVAERRMWDVIERDQE